MSCLAQSLVYSKCSGSMVAFSTISMEYLTQGDPQSTLSAPLNGLGSGNDDQFFTASLLFGVLFLSLPSDCSILEVRDSSL